MRIRVEVLELHLIYRISFLIMRKKIEKFVVYILGGYCGRRTLENSSFSPVHVAMVHQSVPSFESMSSCMQRSLFACKFSSN